MDRDKILRRIQKCLNLAASSEPHEAAAALRQAKALMDKYGIHEAEAAFADIGEAGAKSSGKTAIPAWEANLATAVGESLGCRVLFERGAALYRVRQRVVREAVQVVFVGAVASPDVARYAFEVLRRKLRVARADFRKRSIHRDAARLDAFSYGWVLAVRNKVRDLKPADGVIERVNRALAERNGALKVAAQRDASGLSKGNTAHIRAAAHGLVAGSEVEIHNGVGIDRRPALSGSA
jgi:hypothetical protein